VSKRRRIPGFRLSLGFTLVYLALLVVFPLSSLFVKSASLGPHAFAAVVLAPRALAAYRLTFGASLAAAVLNVLVGGLVAWVLARYRFPGRALVDAIVDVPFALPTAVAGIALAYVWSPHGLFGMLLVPLGVQVAFTPLGIALALTFVGFPFVVRTMQPVLQDLDPEVEEAAACLGASRLETFRRVLLPHLLPGLVTGFTLAFARALGEYGSVVFIAGNMPMRTEIAPLLIVTKLEQFDYAGATAIASSLLVASFVMLMAIHGVHVWAQRRGGQEAT